MCPTLDEEFAAQQRQSLPKRLKALDDLLRRKGIDLVELEKAKIHRVNLWEGFHKDDAKNTVKVDMAGIVFTPSWEDGPEWPVIKQGPPVALPAPRNRRASSKKGWRTAVVLPDMQMGYWRDPDTDKLGTTHDERAIAIALAIARDVEPDEIVCHGDNADFPELSRYRLTPTFQRTTQATIDRCTKLGFELADIARHVVWLAGNHEERLPNYAIDNASAAFGLRRGMKPNDPPVLSMPHLCRFEDSGVEFVPGYPANTHWLNDNLRVIHGDKVNSNGSTAPRYLNEERVSTLYGHIHRREAAERTRPTRNGGRTILAQSFGCLCRTDGAVPSTKGGKDLQGRPVEREEDWQQGIGVVRYHPDGRFAVESIAILNGWAMYRGVEYAA